MLILAESGNTVLPQMAPDGSKSLQMPADASQMPPDADDDDLDDDDGDDDDDDNDDDDDASMPRCLANDACPILPPR